MRAVSTTRYLTAAEAAARLGIKRQTLYAYVSRGVLERTMSLDGKSSLFDPQAVDALRGRRHRTIPGEVRTVIASSLTTISETGHTYRGLPVLDLVEADCSFEDVAELLWARNPPAGPCTGGGAGLREPWRLDPGVLAQIRAVQMSLPGETPLLDRLRVAVAVLSATDPMRHDLSRSSVVSVGRRLLMGMVAGLPKQHIGPHDRLADQLWLALAPEAGSEDQRRALNAALVLLADHDLAASTFAVRVAASVRADPYSLVSTGLGAMGAVLHGAAGSLVHRFLEEADELGPEVALGRRLADGDRIPGVGHKIYRHRDPREVALLDLVRAGWANDERLDTIEEVRALALARLDSGPTVDFALGALTWLADMEPGASELFAIARTAGWIAHAIEELEEPPLRFRVSTRPTSPRPPLPED